MVVRRAENILTGYYFFMKTWLILGLLALASHCTQAQTVPSLPPVRPTAFRADTFAITKFGAVPDGQTLNTGAFTKAIAACAQAGGGVVLVPPGQWLTGPLELQSNVNVHLAAGALVQFSDQLTEYKLIKTSWEGLAAVRNQPLLYGKNLENIALTGAGIFDGAGSAWYMVQKARTLDSEWKKLIASGGVLNERQDRWYPTAQALRGTTVKEAGVLSTEKANVADFEDIKDHLRPDMLVLDHCQRVLLDGPTFQNSPAWTLHPLLSEDITIRHVTVLNPPYSPNTDALDLESCRNGLVEDCTFSAGDDGICLKSGRNEQGRARGVPTENFRIRRCTVYRAHGGFVIGSEMSGGVRNIYASDLTFIGTDIGLRFKTTRGRGGIVENIFIDQVAMKDIAGEAVLFDMYYMIKDPTPQVPGSKERPTSPAMPVDAGTPQFRRIYLSHLTCQGARTGILLRGLPELAIQDISIREAVLRCDRGLICIEAKDISLQHVALLPAATDPVLEVHNSQNITLDDIAYPANAAVLLRVSGAEKSRNIRLLHTATKPARQALELGAGVKKSAVLVKESK
jgi:hypothetical protein